jgi:two-component system phosphate regulon sensor histidine kinase PhoR
MFRKKIICRLFTVLLLFAGLTIVPFSYALIKYAENMLMQREAFHLPAGAGGVPSAFVPILLPFVFYIFVMSFVMSILFLRNTLKSLEQLRRGSLAMKGGDLDVKLDVITDDELADVTRSFNEMAASLRDKTEELRQKDIYINAMLDPLWVTNESDVLMDINPAFTRLLGYEREDVVGTSLYNFFDERNAITMRNQLWGGSERGAASIFEITILKKDGTEMPTLISSSPVYSGGRITGKIGTLKDFREQSALRDELRNSKEYVEAIIDGIEDELVVVDRDFRIIKANKIAIMKAGEASLVGKYCHAVKHGEEAPCFTRGAECPAQTVFITGKNVRSTHQHVSTSGEKTYYEIVASPIKDASGNVLYVIELTRDVTDRMRHENKVSTKNRELVALNNVAEILSSSLLADEIFSRVLDKVIEIMCMDGGAIFFLDEAGRELRCFYHKGVSDELVKLMGRLRLGEDLPGKAAATGQAVATSDLSRDRHIERSMIKHSGIKGSCCIPIKGKEKVMGVLCLFSFIPHAFTSEEANILNSIGEMTAIALENIKLYEKISDLYEHQRKKREDEQEQLLTLSTKLGSAAELGDAMIRVLDEIRNIFGADFLWILVRDDEGNFLLKSAFPLQGQEYGVVYPQGVSSIEGYAIEKRAPAVIADLTSDTTFFLSPLLGRAYRSTISIPLHIGEKTVGVYSLYYREAREFREEELHFLRIIGNILAVAIERSDYYARAIVEKERADTVLQSVADGVITVDTAGRTIAVNRAFEKMSGVAAAEAVGVPICNMLRFTEENVDFRFALGDCIEGALEGGRVRREAVLRTPLGDRMPILISSAPISDEVGQVAGVVNVLRDISREKELDRMKSEIIRSVSYEFRKALLAIIRMIKKMLEGDVDERTRGKYLSTMLAEGNRLTAMASELLNIERIESGRDVMKSGPVAIGRLFSDLTAYFAAVLERKRAEIRCDVEGVESFVADREKMKQLLMNLVDNSLTFCDEGCVVELMARRKGREIEISVSDNGWGVSEEDLQHLTERFYRGKHGARVRGTGLGLSICSEVVKMHGGKMEITSKAGAGTRVIVTLPLREVR